VWPHEQGGQPEHQAIECSQIRGPLSGAITNQQLMFERQRFCGNGADAARMEEFRKRDEQVYRQKDQIAHEWKVIMLVTLRKPAQRGPFGLKSRN
jgi:hypothetical protein